MSASSDGGLPQGPPAAEQAQTLILALGNPLRGDDGVASAVLKALADSGAVPPGVRLQDGGTPGLDTALLLQGYRQAIIIDAADMGLAAGSWRRLTIHPATTAPGATLHSAGLAEALALGEALSILPSNLIVIGIQPQQVDWTPGLSEPVRQAVPAICRAILEELGAAGDVPHLEE